MVNIYTQIDYRSILTSILAEKRDRPSALTNKQFSEAMGIQPSYFSRFIQGNAHISSDQLYLGCQALELSEEETQYLLLLQEWDRCSIASRKVVLKKQIEKIQNDKRNTSQHLKADFIEPEAHENFSEYYLDPMVSIVHTFLSLKEYQEAAYLMCSCLGLSESRLNEILLLLTKLGIIEIDAKSGRYKLLRDHMHLNKNSTLNRAYQTLFRHTALEHLKRTEEAQKYEFAVTFSADEESRQKIHDEFNVFVKKVETFVRSSPVEGVYQLNFDLFRWDTRKTLRKWQKHVAEEKN